VPNPKTLKECLCCHIHCAHHWPRLAAMVTSSFAVSNRYSRYPRPVVVPVPSFSHFPAGRSIEQIPVSTCAVWRGNRGSSRTLACTHLIERDVQALHRTTRWRHGWVMVQPRRLSRCRTQACMPGGAHHWGHPPGVCIVSVCILGGILQGSVLCLYHLRACARMCVNMCV